MSDRRRRAETDADRPAIRVAVLINGVGLRLAKGRLLLAVVDRLVARGYAVDVLVHDPPAWLAARLPAEARAVDISRVWERWLPPRQLGKMGVYLSLAALVRYLRRERPAVLLAGSIPPNVTALLARRLAGVATRIVLRQSNVVAIPGDPDCGGVRARPRDRLVRRLYREADAIVAVSRGVADNTARLPGVTGERVHTVLTGYDGRVPRWSCARPEQPWLSDGGPPVILNVARYVAKKDQATLLRAFARVAATRDARLLILGRDGPERRRLAALAAELGVAERVALGAFTDNPYAAMARARVFVLSSVSEGMPSVVLEALACGCPVVSTDCPSGPREVLADGAFGRLVPVRDPATLAEAITATLDAPPDPERLRTHAAQHTITRAAEAYADVVADQVLAGMAACR
ncbi:Glycosyltransferase involved in cell wall bisynthesis [Limimonas halophila]|uniref:Glycosyltransferase involved in cell wall bisynthesis n=1 Tax=Limimonas halophila TaxID=1082479 RepID=A0A1G7RCG2_9PROT|nr:glycosyltransferase [Limimonas halophila]SDG08486.1 Glycosyltransferase involved in cell wall bisynthesis [Limimonas halophila]